MEKLRYERPIINKIKAGVPDKYGMRTKVEIKTEIAGIPVKDIVDKYGSPVLLSRKIPLEKLIKRHTGLFKAGILKFNLLGRIKPIISMRYVKFFTTKVLGQK